MFVTYAVEGVVTALTTVCTADLTAAGQSDLAELMELVGRVRAALDAAEIDIALRAEQLLDGAGGGLGVDDVFAGWAGTSARRARQTVRRARTVAEAPEIRSHLADGSITSEHADVVAQVVSGLSEPLQALFVAHDAELAAAAAVMTPERFASHCRRPARTVAGDEGRSRLHRQQRDTSVSTRVDAETGMYHLHARFDPVLGAQVFGSLETATRAVYYSTDPADIGGIEPDRRTDWEHVRAHTLARMLSAAATGLDGRAASPILMRAEVVIVVDATTLDQGEHAHTTCRTSDGHDIPVVGARRLLCHALQHIAVVGAEGQVLALGTSKATPNRAQRRALQAMYSTCAWPGCDVVFSRCEIHHVTYRRHGGRTDLDNLLPLCSRHHHHVHDRGWTITLGPDRSVQVHHPDQMPTLGQSRHPSGRDVRRRSERHRTGPPDDVDDAATHHLAPPETPSNRPADTPTNTPPDRLTNTRPDTSPNRPANSPTRSPAEPTSTAEPTSARVTDGSPSQVEVLGLWDTPGGAHAC